MDKQFEQFLEECLSSFGEGYIDVPEEMQAPHKFSMRFRQRMHKLMRQQSNSFSIAKVPRKRRLSMAIALTILIFLSLTTAVICGGQNLFSGFFTKVEADNFFVRNILQENAPDTIEEVYMPAYIPEGYELVTSYIRSEEVHLVYRDNYDYDEQTGYNYIIFSQKIKKSFHPTIDCETGVFLQITINDYPCIEIDRDYSYDFIWNNDDYTFKVSTQGKLDKNEALNIAKSVEKVE